MVEEKKVEPQGEIPPEGGKEIKTPLPKAENFVGPASSSSGQAKRTDPIKPEEPKEKEPVTADLSAEAQRAKAETAEKPAKPAEEKKPEEEKAKPEEVKAPEAPPKKKKKKKKVRNISLEEIEKKLKETEERMGGLESRYAQHLLQRKEEVLKEQKGQPKKEN